MSSFLPEEMTKVLDTGIAYIYSFQPIIEPTVVLGSFHPLLYVMNESIWILTRRFACANYHVNSAGCSSYICFGPVGTYWFWCWNVELYVRFILMLPISNDYDIIALWYDPTFVLVLIRCILIAIHFGGAMDTSVDYKFDCVWNVVGVTS